MNKFYFYFRVLLPNLIFVGVYILFLLNREIFSASANNFTWFGYSFSVLFLTGLSIYLNRLHRLKFTFDNKEECLDNLRKLFFRKGYRLKSANLYRLYFNKALVRSSICTPGIIIYIRQDHFLVEGPKVKVDDVADWIEEFKTNEIQLVEMEHRLAS